MEPNSVQAIQNFGAMAILALMVFKSPSIISAIGSVIESSINSIRATQSEALQVFKTENDKVLALVGDRFKAIEDSLNVSLKTLTALLREMQNITGRIEVLEREKPH